LIGKMAMPPFGPTTCEAYYLHADRRSTPTRTTANPPSTTSL